MAVVEHYDGGMGKMFHGGGSLGGHAPCNRTADNNNDGGDTI
jgi:hypothetical protein